MASKGKWKKRAKQQRQFADEMFAQLQARSGELQRIDDLLLSAEFEGPSIEAYVAQTQQFLQKLVNERGLVKKSSLADLSAMPTEAFISGRPSLPSPTGPTAVEDELLVMTGER